MSKVKSELRIHSRRQLELKIQFPIPDRNKKLYGVDLFLFFPGQLNIDSKNYGISNFLEDYKSNIRYSSPRISLSNLVSLQCYNSPINRIKKKINDNNTLSRSDENYILYELRVLTNIYRLEMKSVSELIVSEFLLGNNLNIINTKIDSHIVESQIFLEKLRSLYLEFMSPEISDKLKLGLSWADECMSMEAEKSLLKIYDKLIKIPHMVATTDRLIKSIEYEILYRNEKGFITLLENEHSPLGEIISYR